MISACFTTYQRTDLLFEAVEPFLKDERITEIVISDDHSTEEIYSTICWKYNGIDKVKIFRNEVNVDCYRNKKLAIERATSNEVFILDSDNVFSKEFIDRALQPRHIFEILQPEFARPHFDFTKYRGLTITKENVAQFFGENDNLGTALNAMNYFVNRESWLSVWDGSIDPVTSDSLYQNYNWLKAGYSIFIVPGMQYEHRVHPGSHYQQNVRRTPSGFHDSIIEKLKQMR